MKSFFFKLFEWYIMILCIEDAASHPKDYFVYYFIPFAIAYILLTKEYRPKESK